MKVTSLEHLLKIKKKNKNKLHVLATFNLYVTLSHITLKIGLYTTSPSHPSFVNYAYVVIAILINANSR